MTMSKGLRQEIKESLDSTSKFSYYKGCTCRVMKESRAITKDYLQTLVMQGSITKRHAFILQVVNALGHATCRMVQQLLAIQHRKYPLKEIPELTYEHLQKELKYLSKNGLLVAYDFVTQEKSVIQIFSCSLYGYTFFRNCLETTISYDENAIFRAEHETFKRLGANSVALAMASDPNCNDCSVNGRFSLVSVPKKFDAYVYAAVEFDFSGQKRLYIIEPTYFSIDYSIATDEEEKVKISNRLDKLESIICQFQKNYDGNVSAVYCVENMKSLIKLGQIIKDRYNNMYSMALFTSENILYHNGYDLDRSFVKFQFGEKSTITPWKDSWRL